MAAQFERSHGGGHERRLSATGTAALLEVIRKRGFDQVQKSLGIDDPREFLYVLLGHRELPNQVVTTLSKPLVVRRLNR